ncbi:MAG TPA: non-canonical purine NTP pyrophosphatase, partial [Thermoplasmata archaeon]|nr:non-canonical purine NTP pyrophosphatase [Thermoplasmata archaeon]
MEIAFVSSNEAKFREIRAILAPQAIRVRWHRRSLPEVQSAHLEEVVRAKLSACPRSKIPLLVEDSGLFLTALGGFPGVYSRYALETIGLRGILTLLRGRSRRAVFRTVAG